MSILSVAVLLAIYSPEWGIYCREVTKVAAEAYIALDVPVKYMVVETCPSCHDETGENR